MPYAHLRYSLGGYRPSQTVNLGPNHPTLGGWRLHAGLECVHRGPRRRLAKGTVKMHRVFPSHCSTLHFHRAFTFTESSPETAERSLHHSCGTAINCQGISLP